MHILVADGNPSSLNALAALLRSWSFTVTAVLSSARAWEVLLRPDPPVICLLERQIPLDGISLCRRIRAQETTRNTYVMISSECGSKQDLLDGFAAGADDYVTKPIEGEQLRARLSLGERVVELQWALAKRTPGEPNA